MTRTIRVNINGADVVRDVDPRMLLSDFIRHEAGLTGTHVGCEHGVCGSCTIQVNGAPVRSCLMFAIQAEGTHVRTVEALSNGTQLHPLQEAFHTEHGLQCGFCTPGFLMSIEPVLDQVPGMDDADIRAMLSGNVCRCTGYDSIVNATRRAAQPSATPHPRQQTHR